jgi:soluble lytic murein transglycosylase-like protein
MVTVFKRFAVALFFIVALFILALGEDCEAQAQKPDYPYQGLCEKGNGDLYTAAFIIREFGVENAVKALRIAGCESSFDPYANNPSTDASGIYQFKPQTWLWVCQEAGVDCSLNARYDAESNIRAGAYLALRKRGGGWQHWECK